MVSQVRVVIMPDYFNNHCFVILSQDVEVNLVLLTEPVLGVGHRNTSVHMVYDDNFSAFLLSELKFSSEPGKNLIIFTRVGFSAFVIHIHTVKSEYSDT